MVILEKVMQMQQMGMSEQQIINSLQQEGISPKEISNALSQSRIKGAVNFSQDEEFPEIDQPIRNIAMQQNPRMQKSMMTNVQQQVQNYPQEYSQNQDSQQNYSDQNYLPNLPYQETEMSQEQTTMPEEYQQYYPDYQQQYTEYQPQQSVDIETMNEIAEQISEEKSEKLKKEISSFTRFKEELSSEVARISARVDRIENVFNELQVAILKKIGSYGEDIKNISREMHTTQESFSKILDPLADNIKDLQRISGKETDADEEQSNETANENPRKSSKKQKMDFEDYLR